MTFDEPRSQEIRALAESTLTTLREKPTIGKLATWLTLLSEFGLKTDDFIDDKNLKSLTEEAEKKRLETKTTLNFVFDKVKGLVPEKMKLPPWSILAIKQTLDDGSITIDDLREISGFDFTLQHIDEMLMTAELRQEKVDEIQELRNILLSPYLDGKLNFIFPQLLLKFIVSRMNDLEIGIKDLDVPEEVRDQLLPFLPN